MLPLVQRTTAAASWQPSMAAAAEGWDSWPWRWQLPMMKCGVQEQERAESDPISPSHSPRCEEEKNASFAPAPPASPRQTSPRRHRSSKGGLLPACSSSLLHKPDLPMVAQATLGRLHLTLPVAPLYLPSPPSDRTRPMSTQPVGASVGYSGPTGFGVSAGLRVGQRLDRRLGDFERIAVEQLSKSSNGAGARRAQYVGSSTGSVTASANIGGAARFTASAYKNEHVPLAGTQQRTRNSNGPILPPTNSARSSGGGGNFSAVLLSHPLAPRDLRSAPETSRSRQQLYTLHDARAKQAEEEAANDDPLPLPAPILAAAPSANGEETTHSGDTEGGGNEE